MKSLKYIGCGAIFMCTAIWLGMVSAFFLDVFILQISWGTFFIVGSAVFGVLIWLYERRNDKSLLHLIGDKINLLGDND